MLVRIPVGDAWTKECGAGLALGGTRRDGEERAGGAPTARAARSCSAQAGRAGWVAVAAPNAPRSSAGWAQDLIRSRSSTSPPAASWRQQREEEERGGREYNPWTALLTHTHTHAHTKRQAPARTQPASQRGCLPIATHQPACRAARLEQEQRPRQTPVARGRGAPFGWLVVSWVGDACLFWWINETIPRQHQWRREPSRAS